jgi:ABC-type uncharacterized transport system auxiliary subunit
LALLASFLVGCGLTKPYPAINTFDVSPTLESQPNLVRSVRPFVVRVSQLNVAAAYETRKLIYKSRAGQLLEDYYNELIAPPGRLLADSLATYLDLKSLSAQFVRSRGQRGADFVLEGYLAELLGDYSLDPPAARLALSITLNDVRRERVKIVLARTYQARIPVPANGGRAPAELVAALTKAWAEVLAAVELDLRESLND